MYSFSSRAASKQRGFFIIIILFGSIHQRERNKPLTERAGILNVKFGFDCDVWALFIVLLWALQRRRAGITELYTSKKTEAQKVPDVFIVFSTYQRCKRRRIRTQQKSHFTSLPRFAHVLLTIHPFHAWNRESEFNSAPPPRFWRSPPTFHSSCRSFTELPLTLRNRHPAIHKPPDARREFNRGSGRQLRRGIPEKWKVRHQGKKLSRGSWCRQTPDHRMENP